MSEKVYRTELIALSFLKRSAYMCENEASLGKTAVNREIVDVS